ncbi:hypothetical protein PISMIDRAFT_677941 [Pisolithus microcarpus 441]|uniref:Uncharacterized protein n=1 Tax=Pisolithus microcarpus 441 TaxID=765257 RepID=A0A0C9YIC9_9AGAM|nr:hypothetical protein PISMIDRAFT_677941 [Pisolithus microcarpus 441]
MGRVCSWVDFTRKSSALLPANKEISTTGRLTLYIRGKQGRLCRGPLAYRKFCSIWVAARRFL